MVIFYFLYIFLEDNTQRGNILIMIYYLFDTYTENNNDIIRKIRKSVISEAGTLRSRYILKCINKKIIIISVAVPKAKGFFKEKKIVIDKRTQVIYLKALNIIGLRMFFSFFFLLDFLIRKIKNKDKIIIYNNDPKFIFALLILKKMKKFYCTLQIEEMYSSYNFKHLKGYIYNLAEKYGIKFSDSYIICNSSIIKYLPKDKKYIINRGYKTWENPNYKNFAKNIKKIPIVLYSGRLDYEGGVEVFLDSLVYIEKECEVIITGNGQLVEKVKNYKNYNKYIKYNYLGFIESEKYKELLIQAKICINPTRGKIPFLENSFPSKIYQYLEYGNIVISSNFLEINNLDGLKKYIYTYNDDSPLEMAKLINKLIDKNYNKSTIAIEFKNYFYNQEISLKRFFTEML